MLRHHRGKHVIRRQRSPDPLQRELTDWLDLYDMLDGHQHTRADQDLPRLGLIAQPRRRYCPDSGVVEPPLEANGAKRSKAVRDTDTEPNVVSQTLPSPPEILQGPPLSRGAEKRCKRGGSPPGRGTKNPPPPPARGGLKGAPPYLMTTPPMAA